MQSPGGQSMLAALLQEQRGLEERIHNLGSCAGDALSVGNALLAFADHEEEAFSALTPLLDPAARQELVTEHQQIAEDLSLLDWLSRTTPDSSDVTMLTTSLVRRMRQHIARDGRLLATASGLNLRR